MAVLVQKLIENLQKLDPNTIVGTAAMGNTYNSYLDKSSHSEMQLVICTDNNRTPPIPDFVVIGAKLDFDDIKETYENYGFRTFYPIQLDTSRWIG